MEPPLYPDVKFRMPNPSSPEGNAYHMMFSIRQLMINSKVPADEIIKFINECESGDYENFKRVLRKWVTIF